MVGSYFQIIYLVILLVPLVDILLGSPASTCEREEEGGLGSLWSFCLVGWPLVAGWLWLGGVWGE